MDFVFCAGRTWFVVRAQGALRSSSEIGGMSHSTMRVVARGTCVNFFTPAIMRDGEFDRTTGWVDAPIRGDEDEMRGLGGTRRFGGGPVYDGQLLR